ncbi:MAG TPA: DUF3850 domain-containing protein [Candidatus Limnocylindria bacterium]|nr:DUF3850 domain-containing protein [Candidatus Limnocylindria bacterium]
MSKVIEKKIRTDYFDQVKSGQKTFELRLADWDCQPGDVLVLKEVDINGQYTGRSLRKKVGFIVKTKELDFFTPQEIEEHGYQVISLLEEGAA